MTFRILMLDHIGTLVHNVDVAAATWRNALGVDSTAPHHAPAVGMTTAMLDFGNAGIDLIQPDADTDAGRRMAKKGEGIYVVTFLVEDLADGIRQFEAKGWRVFEPWGPWRETGVCAVHPRDTMGVFMQLMEDRPGGAFEHSSYLGAPAPGVTPRAVASRRCRVAPLCRMASAGLSPGPPTGLARRAGHRS